MVVIPWPPLRTPGRSPAAGGGSAPPRPPPRPAQSRTSVVQCASRGRSSRGSPPALCRTSTSSRPPPARRSPRSCSRPWPGRCAPIRPGVRRRGVCAGSSRPCRCVSLVFPSLLTITAYYTDSTGLSCCSAERLGAAEQTPQDPQPGARVVDPLQAHLRGRVVPHPADLVELVPELGHLLDELGVGQLAH